MLNLTFSFSNRNKSTRGIAVSEYPAKMIEALNVVELDGVQTLLRFHY
jgi:hypothetical protein